MDIFQRTCHKDALLDDLQPDEVEILDAESLEEALVEEEEELEDEPLDVKALQKELECMKQRIVKLQLKLKALDGRDDECPLASEEVCVDDEVLLRCSENKEVCALQKGHHKLQCQIHELIRCCRYAKDQLADLKMRLCEKSREVQQLQKLVAMLVSWKNTLEHEFGVCIERFEYLKHVKAEWKDVEEMFEKQKKTYASLEASFVPRHCFLQVRAEFMHEIDDLKKLFKELFELQLERFFHMEQRLNGNLADGGGGGGGDAADGADLMTAVDEIDYLAQ